MKIKKFKQAVQAETFDIPNVLEKIKPAAYARKIPHVESVKPAFRWKPIVVTFATIVLVAVMFFSYSHNFKDTDLLDPAENESVNSPEETPSDMDPDTKGLTKETYYEGLYNEAMGVDIEATYSSYLTEEQRSVYLDPTAYFAFYDIVIERNIKDYTSAYNQLVLWGKNNSYDELYFNERESDIYYIFNTLVQ